MEGIASNMLSLVDSFFFNLRTALSQRHRITENTEIQIQCRGSREGRIRKNSEESDHSLIEKVQLAKIALREDKKNSLLANKDALLHLKLIIGRTLVNFWFTTIMPESIFLFSCRDCLHFYRECDTMQLGFSCTWKVHYCVFIHTCVTWKHKHHNASSYAVIPVKMVT